MFKKEEGGRNGIACIVAIPGVSDQFGMVAQSTWLDDSIDFQSSSGVKAFFQFFFGRMALAT